MKKILKWILIILGVIIVCISILIGLALGDSESLKEENTNTKIANTIIAEYTMNAKGIPIETPTQITIAPSFQEIQNRVDQMTEIQWKAYLPTLKGMKVTDWAGWINDVDKRFGDEYQIWVDMDDPNELFTTTDVYLYGINEEQAIVINKGSRIIFSGIISKVSEFLGDITIYVDNVSYQIID